jgi:superoxide dismutase, Cu-Zn family
MESASQRGTFILKSFTIGLLFAAGLVVSHADHGEDYYAICDIKPLGFSGMNISGTIMLHESGSKNQTTVVGHLYGFENITNTKRGFHVHEIGSIDGNCSAAKLHYNPFNVSHGGPNDNIMSRHVGDLGNIIVNNMNLESMFNITDSIISLHGNNSIVNRSLVVHAGEDDLGTGTFDDSKTTGHSGGRIGCCVITLVQPMTTAPPSNSTTSTMSSATSMETFFTGFTFICLAGLQLLIKSMQ